MPPTTGRDFQRAAAQRLAAADVLRINKLTLDAQYVGGYTVECSLKALILESTPQPDRLDQLKRITSGAIMHRPEILMGELRSLGINFPMLLVKRIRRFAWTTDLRYETGHRDAGETIAFLNTARSIYDWVEGSIP